MFLPHAPSHLSVVVLVPSETYDTRRGLIEYNLVFFKEGIQEILDVEAAGRLPLDPPADVT